MSNRLIHEQSPYLQQHAENPVDWYPWGEEAFEKARKEQKPIFLSIGYSSCHWCHVMEREIFDVQEFADILNTHYVSIKVDREERPDIDRFYQELHHVLTQRAGGWPTSIFLTEEKTPIHAATYIPPIAKYGMPSFKEIALGIIDHYNKERDKIFDSANKLQTYMVTKESKVVAAEVDESFPDAIKQSFDSNYDDAFGGFGTSPKFPHAAALELMREYAQLNSDAKIKENLEFTLKTMAKGAMYDVIEGGFCRYSVDHMWWIPHFEKMTYDNGLLAQVYLNTYLYTGDTFYQKIGFEILDFMLERMSEEGLFYSASDADSEGEEGKYFVYKYHEVMEKLQEAGYEKMEADAICRHLSISARGNFENGENAVRNESLQEPEWFPKVQGILKAMRDSREYPFIDKKVIVSWNCMMIKGLFIAGKMENRYLLQAKKSLQALLDFMVVEDKLKHSALIGHTPKIDAFLEDYAFLAGALLEAHQTTLESEYLGQCQSYVDQALKLFYEDGKWYMSRGEFETMAEGQDSSYTSAIGELFNTMLGLSVLKEPGYMETVQKSIGHYIAFAQKHAIFFGAISTAALRLLKGDLVIKAGKGELQKILTKTKSMKHPYYLLEESKESNIQVCTFTACLETYNSLDELMKIHGVD